MTPFLVATLLALLAGGALIITWREHRTRFPQAVGIAVAAGLLVGGYAWWVTHGHELVGDEDSVALTDLKALPVAGSYRVTGTLTNLSRENTLSALPLLLQVERCPAGAPCERLHEVPATLHLQVPPGESRPFYAVFNLPALPADAPLVFRVDHEGPRTYRAAVR